MTYATDTKDEERIGIVIMVPQKIEIASYVLSLSHNFSTGWTTALIHGDCLMGSASGIAEDESATQSGQIRALIKATPTFWAHPLLLPTILLKVYMNRSEAFAWTLDDQVVALEESIGVTFAGRLRRKRPAASDNIILPTRSDMRQLTMGTHTTLTEIIFFCRVVTFSRDCAAYLSKLNDELGPRILAQRRASFSHTARELQGTARYMESSSNSMQGFCATLKERVLSQIQVLYSVTAQTDNRLSARIAVSSGRDSTAMKTLAFITALFLPGTYVATLFSMSMFEWNASSSPSSPSSSSSSSPILSSKFWIYWAITIPLTIAVIAFWRVWWVQQDKAYQAQLAGEMDDLGGKNCGANHKETHGLLHRKPLHGLFKPGADRKMEDRDLDGF